MIGMFFNGEFVEHTGVFQLRVNGIPTFYPALTLVDLIINMLDMPLIIPKIRLQRLFFQLSDFFTFAVEVKDTSSGHSNDLLAW